MRHLPLKSLLVLFAVHLCVSSVMASLAGDTQTLIRVKAKLSDPDGKLDDWVPNSDHNPCNWTGITCEPNTHTVLAVNISGLGIAGGFPYGFCHIRTLRNLSVSFNSINGSLQTQTLSLCSHLQVLELESNYIVGELPEFSPDFTDLQVLDLQSNNFSGDIPASFGRLPSLKVLLLSQNLLNGSIPSFLCNLTELTRLALAYNPFKHAVLPSEIGNLTKLETLFIPQSNVKGQIPDSIGNLVSLKSLDLSQNSLTGVLPESIGRLRSAFEIELFTNHLFGELPESIANLSSLRYLDLSLNAFTGKLSEKIAGMRLVSLNLNDNFLQGEVPQILGSNPILRQLKLFNNSFSGSLPENLGRYSDLDDLDVSTNKFTGELPKYLCYKKKLTRLVAFSNQFSGNLPDTLSECDSLGYVRIEHNEFSGVVSDKFWGLPLLTFLQINNNRFNGTFSPSISAANGLTTLLISGNQFSGGIPPEMCKLSDLAKLDLSKNQFSGDLPLCITELKKLQKLKMQENMFSGQIPSQVSSWTELIELNLASNQLSGWIPPELGDLPVLNYLDLSENFLTGEIPVELTKLKLNQFNVSNNKLYGKIPSGFNYELYVSGLMGNPNLCSPDLKPMPTCSKPKSAAPFLIVILSVCVLLLVGSLAWYLKLRSKAFGGKTKRLYRVTTFQRVGFNEEEVMSSLTKENQIATGGSGHVYRVKLKTGQTVAVKKLWGGSREPETEGVFRSEVETLGRIRHGNIVKLMFCCSGEDSRILGYEYMENGSLGDCLHGEKVGALEDWAKRFEIAVGSAHGLAYLHHDCVPAIVHRDVKSNNILLDEDWTPRLADFGLAKTLQKDVAAGCGAMSRIAGSYGYIAPEYAYTLKVTEKSDVYSFAQPNTRAHPPKMESQSLQPKQIFILSGQSNMAGRGGVFRDHHHHQHWDRVVPNECGPHPSIHRLSAHLQWEPAHEPLHADIDAKVCGVGPGMAFANGVRERVGVVGLVPCAVGGTAIKEWARGEHLYESMVKRARASVKGGGEMKGLLWYQGESDTSTQHDADAYHGNMVKLIENVREDLGLPSLPIIQVAIGSGDAKYIEKVREAQLGMNVPNVVCVDAKGLELKDDHLHLTTKAQVQLGHMLADAYIKHFVSSVANAHPAL